MSAATYLIGDVFDVLAHLKRDGTQVDLVLSSPPFLALRSYLPADHPDKAKEIGSEATPADFIDTMLDVVEACDRVLAPHGSLVFELGDTFAGSGGAGGDYKPDGWRAGQNGAAGSAKHERTQKVDGWGPLRDDFKGGGPGGAGWPLDKSVCWMPELFGASLSYGRNLLRPERTTAPWRVRNKVAWVRPNPPVGALGDKFRPAWSLLTVACHARDRWFDLDAVRGEPIEPKVTKVGPASASRGIAGGDSGNPEKERLTGNPAGAPPLDWWKISPGGYSGSHYAVFPPELLVRPIEAMCPRRVCRTCGTPSRRLSETTGMVDSSGKPAERHVWPSSIADGKAAHTAKRDGGMTTTTTTTTGWTSCGCPGTDGIRLDGFHTGTGWRPGIVLDPFGGSGTTGVVATGHGRDCILIDLDERNADLARDRLGMFLDVVDLSVSEGAA